VSLQHTDTHCNSLQHTDTHCNSLPHTAVLRHIAATHCNTRQCCSVSMQHTATHYNTLQHTAVLRRMDATHYLQRHIAAVRKDSYLRCNCSCNCGVLHFVAIPAMSRVMCACVCMRVCMRACVCAGVCVDKRASRPLRRYTLSLSLTQKHIFSNCARRNCRK